jgi:serine/threonine protein kinase
MTKVSTAALKAALRHFGITLDFYLGTRPFTECFAGTHIDSGKKVFIKALHSSVESIERNFLRELKVLEAFSGQSGFPALLASCSEPSLLFSACEYLSSPSLCEALQPTGSVTMHYILQSAASLSRWIRNLHRSGYAHRDLSPDHVFPNGDYLPTVIDFGMAKRISEIPAQEAQLYEGYDTQAFGMIIWELICRRPIFPYRGEELSLQIAEEIKLVQSAALPAELCGLILSCLSARSEFCPNGLQEYKPFRSAPEPELGIQAVAGAEF